AAVALDDEDAGSLLAAPVAARRLARRERLQEPLGERASSCRLERLGERVHDRGPREDVALRGVPGPGPASGPVVTPAPGERRGAAFAVDDAELADLALLVGLGQPPHD